MDAEVGRRPDAVSKSKSSSSPPAEAKHKHLISAVEWKEFYFTRDVKGKLYSCPASSRRESLGNQRAGTKKNTQKSQQIPEKFPKKSIQAVLEFEQDSFPTCKKCHNTMRKGRSESEVAVVSEPPEG